MKFMSHRQRVLTALNHQEPDFVPLDLGTGGNTSPVPETYAKLAKYFQVTRPMQLVPHIMRLAVVDERILQELDIDTRPVYMNPVTAGVRPCSEPGSFYDEWGVKWKENVVDGVIYREVAESPLENATIEDIERYPWWPDPLDPARYHGVKEHAEALYSETDYALVGCPAFNSVWERAYFLCGFARMLESLVLEPEFVHAIFSKIATIAKISLERFLALTGAYLQVVKMGDDLGGQENPLISPQVYKRTIKPYHQELFRCIKQHSEARVFLHTCGSVYKLLPELLDAGVEILNPVQVSAKGMDTRRLKADFGSGLTFWGAIDTQHILPHGSIQDVEHEVKERITHLAPGGGYILAPVHNIQADVPAENVITMYRYARQIGSYPLS